MRKLTKESIRMIYELWNSDLNFEEIAREVGISPSYLRSVVYRMRKAGIPLSRRIRRVNPIDEFVKELKHES